MNRNAVGISVGAGLLCLGVVGGFLLNQRVTATPAVDSSLDPQADSYKFIKPDTLETTADAVKAANLVTTVVQAEDLPVTLTLTGRTGLDMERVTHVHAQFGGKVREVKPELGAVVQGPGPTTQPTVLCVIESNDLAQAKAGYLQAKVQLKLDNDNLDRAAELVKSTVLAEKFLLDAKSAVIKDAALLEAARQQLLVFGLHQPEIDQIESEQGKQRMDYVITSPRSGVIAEKGVSGGEIADATVNLFTIADTSKMWVWGDVYERDLKRIKVGEKSKVFLTSDPDNPREFTIDWISPELDPNTHSIRVRGTIDNKDGRVLADMYGTIIVTVDAGTNSIVVPAEAVVRSRSAAFVFVQVESVDGKLRYRKTPVTVEAVDVGFGTTDTAVAASPQQELSDRPAALLRISSGLKPGDIVVSHGALGLFSELEQDAQ
jgi:cobalt-zinc-cadmium efflux system membrane fusion protein